MNLWGPLRLVLQTIQKLQGDTSAWIRDSEIAEKARMPLKNVRYCLVVLHENDFISLTPLRDHSLSASVEAKGRVALTYPSNVPLVTWSTVRAAPKGLRPFAKEDSAFYLDLLPGSRDARGLPESIGYWKDRIEADDPEMTFKVGILYGPSGSGKSSMVRAGLIPKLADRIHVIDLEATESGTEVSLLKGIQKFIPNFKQSTSLWQALTHLAKGHEAVGHQDKILLVIDQDGRVPPVRLSLFAQMLAEKEWSPTTLEGLGGAEGIGEAFLEETFVSPRANPAYRHHRRAVESILKVLLPEGDNNI
jgi:hypothetical protein